MCSKGWALWEEQQDTDLGRGPGESLMRDLWAGAGQLRADEGSPWGWRRHCAEAWGQSRAGGTGGMGAGHLLSSVSWAQQAGRGRCRGLSLQRPLAPTPIPTPLQLLIQDACPEQA